MFEIDKRSLALFRMGVGLYLIFDCIDRLSVFTLHYTSKGIVAFHPPLGSFPNYSLHQLFDAPFYQALLFALLIAGAVSLVVGYRSRASALLCWLLTLSLHHHSPLILYGADFAERFMLLFAMFLPIGARFSFDAKFSKIPDADNRVSSLATAAVTAQILTIFIAAFWHKVNDLEWLNGLGVQYALMAYPTLLGRYVLLLGQWLKPISYIIIGVQVVGPLLLLGHWRMRFCGALLLISFQVTLALCIQVVLFPMVMISALLLFVPTEVWNFIPRRKAITSPSTWAPRWSHLLIAILIGCLLPNLSESRFVSEPQLLTQTLKVFGLEQDWSMFVPVPHSVEWIAMTAQIADGRTIDLVTSKEFAGWRRYATSEVPSYIRWGALSYRIAYDSDALKRLARALCPYVEDLLKTEIPSVSVVLVSQRLDSIYPKPEGAAVFTYPQACH